MTRPSNCAKGAGVPAFDAEGGGVEYGLDERWPFSFIRTDHTRVRARHGLARTHCYYDGMDSIELSGLLASHARVRGR